MPTVLAGDSVLVLHTFGDHEIAVEVHPSRGRAWLTHHCAYASAGRTVAWALVIHYADPAGEGKCMYALDW
jgi:hypothetical protein